jgi:hypothetical protein
LRQELQKVQQQIQQREAGRKQERVRYLLQLQNLSNLKDTSFRSVLNLKDGQLGPEVREALSEVEKARASLQAAEQKLRAALRKSLTASKEDMKSKARNTARESRRLELKLDPSRGSQGSQEERLRALERRLEALQRVIERLEKQHNKGGADETSSRLPPRSAAGN